MALSSMTGFARETGNSGPWRFVWELKTVNAKGLDIRLRVPAAFEILAEEARGRLGKALGRGTCFATLTTQREAAAPLPRINTALLEALVAALEPYDGRTGMRAASLGSLLGIRGVVDIVEGEDEAALAEAAAADVLACLDRCVEELKVARGREGRELFTVLEARLAAIAALAKAADEAPARKPDAIRARLAEQIAALMDSGKSLDPNRLHQEAVLIAAKADIREEIDRLKAHVGAARELLGKGGPVGRRLDFLAQEFSREANTLCAKANDVALTVIGLDLKTEVEQFREQVQNVE
jgi:uncharacterized protein (TIGR00255 family)